VKVNSHLHPGGFRKRKGGRKNSPKIDAKDEALCVVAIRNPWGKARKPLVCFLRPINAGIRHPVKNLYGGKRGRHRDNRLRSGHWADPSQVKKKKTMSKDLHARKKEKKKGGKDAHQFNPFRWKKLI